MLPSFGIQTKPNKGAPKLAPLTDDEIALLTTEEKLAHDWQDDELRRALNADHAWLHPESVKADLLRRWVLASARLARVWAAALDERDYDWQTPGYWHGLAASFSVEDMEDGTEFKPTAWSSLAAPALFGADASDRDNSQDRNSLGTKTAYDPKPLDAYTGIAWELKNQRFATRQELSHFCGFRYSKSKPIASWKYNRRWFGSPAAVREFFDLEDNYTPRVLLPGANGRPQDTMTSGSTSAYPIIVPKVEDVEWRTVKLAADLPPAGPCHAPRLVSMAEQDEMRRQRWSTDQITAFDAVKVKLVESSDEKREALLDVLARDPEEAMAWQNAADPDMEAAIPSFEA